MQKRIPQKFSLKIYGFVAAVICTFSLYNCTGEVVHNINLDYEGNDLVLFGPGYISTPLYERDMAISQEGNEIIFTRGNHKQTIRTLVSIKKDNDGWSEKKILPFSGRYQDIEPFYSTDGKYLYFASNRPLDRDSSRTDYNIWRVEKQDNSWGQPMALDSVINTKGDEFYPSLSSNGNLYFTANRNNGIGREDIFVSKYDNGRFKTPQVLDSTVNTLSFEFNAYIDPDEALLVFSSYGRPDGMGGGDLYFSTKDANGHWQEARNLGKHINSESLDFCPFIDINRGIFYFSSDRAIPLESRLENIDGLEAEANRILNGMGNIYRIRLEDLDIEY